MRLERLIVVVPLLFMSCGTADHAAQGTPAAGDTPIAEAGVDQTVRSGAVVTLDGSASSDPAGLSLAFDWTQASGPTATLSDPNVAQPGFVAPVVAAVDPAQVLVFTLTVTNTGGKSATANVAVTVSAALPAHPPPVANAGPNQSVASGAAPVTLDGSASFDADGESVTFAWAQTAGPAVALDTAASVQPTFTAPTVASGSPPITLEFSLVVTDASASSASSAVTILVNPDGAATCGSGLPPPPPGTPQPATDPTPPPTGGNGSHRFEIGTDLGTGGVTVLNPAAGEPTVQGFVVVSFDKGPAPADAVVTVNGVPLTRVGSPGASGLFWQLDPPPAPQPQVGSNSELVINAVATDPADTRKQIQRTLVLQCPADIQVTITPSPGAPLGAVASLNLTSSTNILLNQVSPLFSPYGPKVTLRGYDPCTRTLGDGVTITSIVTANGFDVDAPVLATTSAAYLLDLRWPGPGFLDGQTGGYCQLAKRFFFTK